MSDICTTDLADFGFRERVILIELLQAWQSQGLPDDFSLDEVRPMMNKHSGNVFLTNEEFQVAMMNGDKLEVWHSSPYEGKEGFFDDLVAEYAEMHPEDQEWLRDIASARGVELPDLEESEVEEDEPLNCFSIEHLLGF